MRQIIFQGNFYSHLASGQQKPMKDDIYNNKFQTNGTAEKNIY
jgi:hypothetical protein